MADRTRLQMIDWTLEILGAKPAGQSAVAEDEDLAGKYFDTAYRRLRKKGLAPFDPNAVPDWAQASIANYVARDAAAAFGATGELLATLDADKREAIRELTEQVSGDPQQAPIVPQWM